MAGITRKTVMLSRLWEVVAFGLDARRSMMLMTRKEALDRYVSVSNLRKKMVLLLMKWDPDDTVYGNSERLGISVLRAGSLRQYYRLRCRTNRNSRGGSSSERNKKIVLFTSQGIPYQDIAQLYGISRQRVEQISRKNGQT